VTAVRRASADNPSAKAGGVLTVVCIGVNAGPAHAQCVEFSFQIATNDQAGTDLCGDAIAGSGGQHRDHRAASDMGHDGERSRRCSRRRNRRGRNRAAAGVTVRTVADATLRR
jgi:hypothetical protein